MHLCCLLDGRLCLWPHCRSACLSVHDRLGHRARAIEPGSQGLCCCHLTVAGDAPKKRNARNHQRASVLCRARHVAAWARPIAVDRDCLQQRHTHASAIPNYALLRLDGDGVLMGNGREVHHVLLCLHSRASWVGPCSALPFLHLSPRQHEVVIAVTEVTAHDHILCLLLPSQTRRALLYAVLRRLNCFLCNG